MHFTNGIIIQRFSNDTPAQLLVATPTTGKRSFVPIPYEILPYYPPKERASLPIVGQINTEREGG